jgi:hypothetical protein
VLTRDTNIVVLGSVALVLAGGWVVAGRRQRAGATEPAEPAEPVGEVADTGGGDGSPGEVAAPGAPATARGADERPGRAWMLVGALGLCAAIVLSMWSSSAGQRQLVPLRHVFAVRILPYEDRVLWFADQGMPEPELFLPAPDVVDPERPPVVGVPEDDPAYAEWWQWLEEDGRSALILWALTHPSYLVTEPLQDPERVFNNADGTVLGYAPSDMRHVPVVSSLLWLPTIPTVAVALAVAAWYRRRRVPVTPLVGVAGLCVLVSGPLAFIAWHADGMESARHLFFAAVLVRLGALLMVVSLLESWPVGSPAPARTDGGEGPIDRPSPPASAAPSTGREAGAVAPGA